MIGNMKAPHSAKHAAQPAGFPLQSQISSKKRQIKNLKRDVDDEDHYRSDWQSDPGNDDDNKLDLAERIIDGSFLPAIVAFEKGILNLEHPVDIESGLTILHYACLYGNIKALRYIFSNCTNNFKGQVQDYDSLSSIEQSSAILDHI